MLFVDAYLSVVCTACQMCLLDTFDMHLLSGHQAVDAHNTVHFAHKYEVLSSVNGIC